MCLIKKKGSIYLIIIIEEIVLNEFLILCQQYSDCRKTAKNKLPTAQKKNPIKSSYCFHFQLTTTQYNSKMRKKRHFSVYIFTITELFDRQSARIDL